ncbi:hypothetical protein BASA81_003688 [Batrachochytrium salamandrivorans]|nr:hypothetical protein BASA81_003688 [Batrachochytrium salamandrivorans]
MHNELEQVCRRLEQRERELTDALRAIQLLESEALELGLELNAPDFYVSVRSPPRTPPTPPTPSPPPPPPLKLISTARRQSLVVPQRPPLKPLDLSRNNIKTPSLHPKVPFVPSTTKVTFNSYSKLQQQQRNRILHPSRYSMEEKY